MMLTMSSRFFHLASVSPTPHFRSGMLVSPFSTGSLAWNARSLTSGNAREAKWYSYMRAIQRGQTNRLDRSRHLKKYPCQSVNRGGLHLSWKRKICHIGLSTLDNGSLRRAITSSTLVTRHKILLGQLEPTSIFSDACKPCAKHFKRGNWWQLAALASWQ